MFCSTERLRTVFILTAGHVPDLFLYVKYETRHGQTE